MGLEKLEKLDAAYDEAKKEAEEEYDWYAKRLWRYRLLTWVVRGLSAVALVLGVLLPLSQSNDTVSILRLTFSGPAQVGYACLAIAGLIIGADQVFMISSSWRRYTSAMTKIKTLIKSIEFDWKALREELTEPVPLQESLKAISLFKTLVVGAREIVETETSAWSTDLVKALEQLRSLVNEQKTAVKSLANEEEKMREAAQKLANSTTVGSVRVKLEGAIERLRGSFKITIDSHVEDRTAPVTTIVVSDVQVGVRKITMSGKDAKGLEVLAEDVAVVTANSVTDASLVIPKG